MRNPLSMMTDRIRHLIYGEHPDVPPEVRKASHDLANEVQAVSAQLYRIKRSPDPFAELVCALRGSPDDSHRTGTG